MKNLIKNNIIIIVIVLMVIAAIILSKKNKIPTSDIATDSPIETVGQNTNDRRSISIKSVVKDEEAKTIDVTGTARLVYFEGTFPAELLNSSGQKVWQGYASAQTDWMTEDPVDFMLFIETNSLPKGNYTLVLKDGSPADESETGLKPYILQKKIEI